MKKEITTLVKNAAAAAGVTAGFYNALLNRHYPKIDGLEVSKVTKLIQVVTIGQIKDLGINPKVYNLVNTDGLAGRFNNTRNYVFPLYCLENLFTEADYKKFIKAYENAISVKYSAGSPEIKAEEKKQQESKILSMTKALLAPTSKRIKADTVTEKKQDVKTEQKVLDIKKSKKVLERVLTPEVKDQIWQEVKAEKTEEKKTAKESVKESVKAADTVTDTKKAMLNAALNSGKLVICGAGIDIKKQDKAPVKEEKKEDPKIIEPEVTKSVTIDADYLDKLTAAKSEKKEKKSKKASKKTETNSYELLFS